MDINLCAPETCSEAQPSMGWMDSPVVTNRAAGMPLSATDQEGSDMTDESLVVLEEDSMARIRIEHQLGVCHGVNIV